MRGVVMLVAALLLLGAACSEPPPYVPYASGSRLRARTIVAEGAPPVFEGFWDNERKEACTFQRASDGRFRCRPFAEGLAVVLGYADAACTQPIVDAASSCTTSPYRQSSYDSCGSHLYREAREVGAGTPLFQEFGEGACGEATVLTGPALVLEAVPDEAFVAADEATYFARPIAQQVVHAEDGAHEYRELRDIATGARLFPGFFFSGGRLRPFAGGVQGEPGTGDFADLGCSVRLSCDYPSSCDAWEPRAPFVSVSQVVDGCYESTLHELGDTRVRVARLVDGVCEPVDVDPPFGGSPGPACHAIGAAVPASRFPATRIVREGSGRLQVVRSQVVDGPDVVPVRVPADEGFFDTQLGSYCVARPATDGVLRCLPVESRANLYADSSCTIPVGAEVYGGGFFCSQDGDAAPVKPRFAYESSTCAVTQGSLRIFDVGEMISGPANGFERGFLGDCVRMDPTRNAGRIFYTVSEHDPTDFVPVTEHMD